MFDLLVAALITLSRNRMEHTSFLHSLQYSPHEHLCFVQQPLCVKAKLHILMTSEYYKLGRNILRQDVAVLTKFIYEHSLFFPWNSRAFPGSFLSCQFYLDSACPMSNTVTYPKLQMMVVCVSSLSYAAFQILPSPEQTSLMTLSF